MRWYLSFAALVVAATALLLVGYDLVVNFGYEFSSPKFLLFLTLSIGVIVDRLMATLSEFASSRTDHVNRVRLDKLTDTIDALPALMATRSEIILNTPGAGIAYSIARVPDATEVKNVVCRSGQSTSRLAANGHDLYPAYIAAKRASIKGGTVWIEIVSCHLREDDQQKAFMREMTQNFPNYFGYAIDDKKHLMAQMTIFRFRDGTKEAVWGWECDGFRNAPCFVERNPAKIEYLENYFEQCKTRLGEEYVTRAGSC